LNNGKFGDFIDRINPIELGNTGRFASYLDLHLEIDNASWLRTKIYD
jgi:hypothetical protein